MVAGGRRVTHCRASCDHMRAPLRCLGVHVATLPLLPGHGEVHQAGVGVCACVGVLCFRADPFVEVGLSEKGEHLLGAAGEVHLETVVKDLQERFARVPFQVSETQRQELPEGRRAQGEWKGVVTDVQNRQPLLCMSK